MSDPWPTKCVVEEDKFHLEARNALMWARESLDVTIPGVGPWLSPGLAY